MNSRGVGMPEQENKLAFLGDSWESITTLKRSL